MFQKLIEHLQCTESKLLQKEELLFLRIENPGNKMALLIHLFAFLGGGLEMLINSYIDIYLNYTIEYIYTFLHLNMNKNIIYK
jgi:hypothetical protein